MPHHTYNRKEILENITPIIENTAMRCGVIPIEIDLVKESKLQNISNEKILKSLPEDFSKAVSKSLTETTTPYLENILYSLNKLNESINKGGNSDVVDKLF